MSHEQEPIFNTRRALSALEHSLQILEVCTSNQEIRDVLAQSRAASDTAAQGICFKKEGAFRLTQTCIEDGQRVLDNLDNSRRKLELSKQLLPSDSLFKSRGSSSARSGDLQEYLAALDDVSRDTSGEDEAPIFW